MWETRNTRSRRCSARRRGSRCKAIHPLLPCKPSWCCIRKGLESNQAREKLNQFYHLQLADSRSAAGAERKRAELQRKFAKELTDIAVLAPARPARRAPGAMFQVISGPMSEAAANATCATLERAHQSCKLVQGVGAARAAGILERQLRVREFVEVGPETLGNEFAGGHIISSND